MKKLIPFLAIALLVLGCGPKKRVITLEELPRELAQLRNVVAVDTLPFDAEELPFVKAKYLVTIDQPLNAKDPEAGKFTQRFVLIHSGFDKPVVFQTEGYSANYALRPKYASELTRHYEANEVIVEHRFFEESTPNPRQWEYMRGIYAADDLHKINSEIRKIYSGKFITTGISKGGQTVMFYKTYYPEDADMSVPYVGPLCFAVVDGRHEVFLEQVGTQEQRDTIRAFQREVLKRRDKMVPMLEEYSKENNLEYRVINSNELLDYCVLELSFSMWQWGTSPSELPALNASDKEIFDALMRYAGPEYFAVNSSEAFDVQALAELGYYSYYLEPFKDLLFITTTEDYLRNIFVPVEARETKFDVTQANAIVEYMDKNDPKMIFIYGEYDPWTAPAPHDSLFAGKKNMRKYVQPKGSHLSRINNMPDSVRMEIYELLDMWLTE